MGSYSSVSRGGYLGWWYFEDGKYYSMFTDWYIPVEREKLRVQEMEGIITGIQSLTIQDKTESEAQVEILALEQG